MQMPPQIPPQMPVKQPMRFGDKVILLAIQCGVLMIGAALIWLMSDSRDESSKKVSNQITQEWGEHVSIFGPFATDSHGSYGIPKNAITPETFKCEANVETQSLHRNIYEVEVFNAHVTIGGTFNKASLTSRYDSVYIQLNMPTGQIVNLAPLEIAGKNIDWQKSNHCLYARVDVSDTPELIEFSTKLDIRGSHQLSIDQIGHFSTITIDGDANNPSFQGSRLPINRDIQGRQFSAKWETDTATLTEFDRSRVGVDFLVGVDRYQKVNRSLKYAFMIILLTYISVLFTEIILKRKIPLFNYFLIGAALIIFYILLLSFSEHVSFGIAYLIASIMTISLITGYMWKMIGSRTVGTVIGAILILLYVSCYIMLCLTTYALLLGSMILFIALAGMMYGSLRLKH